MLKDFTKGLFKENPIFVLMLGLCPALAVSTRLINALGLGAAVIIVLLATNVLISLLKNFIPEKVRLLSYFVVIATLVTIVDLLMRAFLPALSQNLGVFVPLIAVNCVIIGRAKAFARGNTVASSALDAFGMGLGFTLALSLIALIREMVGSGTVTLLPLPLAGLEDGKIEIPALIDAPVAVFAAPAGAFLVIGLLIGLFNAWSEVKKSGRSLGDVLRDALKRKKKETGGKGGEA